MPRVDGNSRQSKQGRRSAVAWPHGTINRARAVLVVKRALVPQKHGKEASAKKTPDIRCSLGRPALLASSASARTTLEQHARKANQRDKHRWKEKTSERGLNTSMELLPHCLGKYRWSHPCLRMRPRRPGLRGYPPAARDAQRRHRKVCPQPPPGLPPPAATSSASLGKTVGRKISKGRGGGASLGQQQTGKTKQTFFFIKTSALFQTNKQIGRAA